MNSNNNVLKSYISCACGCGELIEECNKWGYKRKFKHGHNSNINTYYKTPSGKDHPNWKGGITLLKNGYYVHNQSKKYLHRLIYEEYYNCCILPNIHVHHKDGNKLNNDINNLELKSKAEHHSYHAKIQWSHNNRI